MAPKVPSPHRSLAARCRNWGRWLLSAVAALVLAGLVLETGLRLAGFGHRAQFYYDPDVGYRFYPGETRPTRPRLPPIRTNWTGYRGPEFPREKVEGTLRIACLGDSWTFGVGVGETETYPSRLQELLREPLDPVEVLNFSFPGYNTENELACYREVVRPLRPDLVVVGLALEDVRPNLPGPRNTDHSLFRPFARTALLHAFNKHLLVRLELFSADVPPERVEALERYEENIMTILHEPRAEVSRPYWDTCMAALESLVGEVHADGAELLVACFPSMAQVREARANARDPGWTPTDLAALAEAQAYVQSECERMGVACVDVLGHFVASEVDPLHALARSHPSPHGHQLIARRVGRAVLEWRGAVGDRAK